MKKIILVLLLLVGGVAGLFYASGEKQGKIQKSENYEVAVGDLISTKLKYIGEHGVDVRVEGKSLSKFGYKLLIDDEANIYASELFMEDIMCCSVNIYPDGHVTVDRGDASLEFKAAETKTQDDEVYIPIGNHIDELGYRLEFSFVDDMVNFINTDGGMYLPEAYDMREHDRVTPVRDQGNEGTCWAFASLGALETTTLPEEEEIYSVDHMSMNNGFSLDLSEGGEHTMSIAYMAAWRGPVLEKDDEYGDGETDESLTAVKHLKEAIIINDRDDNKIKSAIYKYGGVETSIYLEMPYGVDDSKYYNSETYSYFYNGFEEPNHDLVVVGWDDNYPKEKFAIEPSSNGAFICKNSWGEEFGDKGYFYISYDDVNICQKSIIYTKLDDPDDYDNIYQTDVLGWVGQMGFSEESAYFANVYEAKGDETLKAVSFYATGPDTKFSVFVVTDYDDMLSLNSNRQQVGKGETRYAGYYTVDLTQEINLDKGQKYAIIVSITTPGSERPIAIECDAGDRTANLDLEDGEGYMSLYGESWHNAEEESANICLKAFTVDRK